MRHFAHHIGDYAAATAHLSFIEDAAYHRLLRRYYQDEKPLPADLAATQRLVGARSRDEREAVKNVLEEFFALGADGWHQVRADKEIDVYRAKADAARENGTKGGRPANRTKTKEVIPPVQSEKLTTPHEPLAKEIDEAFALFVESAKRIGWAEPRGMDKTRRRKIGARLDEHGIDGWKAMLAKAEASEFIRTKMSGWSLDWVINPTNFTKVIEGNYDAKPQAIKLDASTTTVDRDGESQWRARVSGWKPGRMWLRNDWGPPPNEPGTRVPEPILAAWRQQEAA